MVTRKIYSITDLPNLPAVYAMYGGRGQGLYIAYVGVADGLKNRISQHLVRRDSSVTTGASAAMLNPDKVTEVKWWEHESFQERHVLEAAELVAFKILEPALRSRGAIQHKSRQVYETPDFQEKMKSLFLGGPTGHLILRDLRDAFSMIEALERRVDELERKLGKSE